VRWSAHSADEVSIPGGRHEVGLSVTHMVGCRKCTIRSSDFSASVLQPLESLLQLWLASLEFYHILFRLILEK
jgi:hypothetical protein